MLYLYHTLKYKPQNSIFKAYSSVQRAAASHSLDKHQVPALSNARVR